MEATNLKKRHLGRRRDAGTWLGQVFPLRLSTPTRGLGSLVREADQRFDATCTSDQYISASWLSVSRITRSHPHSRLSLTVVRCPRSPGGGSIPKAGCAK
jgi:hypothetical protein